MFNLEIDLKNFLYFLEFGEDRSSNSIKSIKSDLKQFIEFIKLREEIENYEDITQFIIRSFMSWVNKKNVGKRSLNRKLSTLRIFFKYLMEKEKINKNPAKLVDFQNFNSEEPEFISFEEIQKLRKIISCSTVNGIRDRLIIELLYSSGITSQELLLLGEGVFDLENRTAKVINGKENRIVFFSERTKFYFKEYILKKKEKYREKYNSDILFVNGSGTRLSDRSLRRIINRYSERAEIKSEVTPYTFRHTFAIHMLVKGMDMNSVKEIMGHSTIEITKIYKEISKRPEIRAIIPK